MKVLIVEEALKSLHGHWFQYISDIVNGGREAGHEIEVAVHKDAGPEILKALPAYPILDASVFEPQPAGAGKLSGLKRVFSHNRSLYRALKKFLDGGKSYDVIISTSTRLDHLLAYQALHWRFRRNRRLRFVLVFIDAVGTYSADYSVLRFSKKLIPFQAALKWTRLLPGNERFFMVAESEGMARHFNKLCGIKFGVVPHVTVLPALEPFHAKIKKAPGDPLTLGVYGFTRYDKGLDVLQDAIKILSQRREKLEMRFVLQWTGDYRLPDGAWIRKDQFLESSSLVQYIPAFSASDEYYEWIARTDIMVLPYRKDFYYDRLSRVAIDAALAGMPFIYPAGTWLEAFAKQCGTGVSFADENPGSLADAICRAAGKFPGLKSRAMAGRQSASEAFSARTFFDVIARLPGVDEPNLRAT